MRHDWMIYGASGYTARLIAREAVRRGQRPVLAGRSQSRIEPLAKELHCPWRVFAMRSPEQIAAQLTGVEAVLNCAGPFSATARPMIEACLKAGVHYLDITGEIDVIEAAAGFDAPARDRGVSIIPAVGFDVVPTDCLAAMLVQRLPDATGLELAFADDNGISPGTAKTIVEMLDRGGRIRRDGKIVTVPNAWQTQKIRFNDRARWAMTIPWGDVASAWHTTGIGNIMVYTAVPRRASRWMRRLGGLSRLAGFPPVEWLLKRLVDVGVSGPADESLERGRAHIWGRVSDAAGNQFSATLETPAAYHLTRLTALLALDKLLAASRRGGFFTPSRAFGAEMILEIDGVVLDMPAS